MSNWTLGIDPGPMLKKCWGCGSKKMVCARFLATLTRRELYHLVRAGWIVATMDKQDVIDLREFLVECERFYNATKALMQFIYFLGVVDDIPPEIDEKHKGFGSRYAEALGKMLDKYGTPLSAALDGITIKEKNDA